MTDQSVPKGPPGFIEPTAVQRLLARLIDSALLLPLALLISAVADGRGGSAATLSIATVYEIILVSRRGQTLGKIAIKTRVVDIESGSAPNTAHAALRWLVLGGGSLVSLVIPALETWTVIYTLILLVPILRPPRHRGGHDIASRTVVTSIV